MTYSHRAPLFPTIGCYRPPALLTTAEKHYNLPTTTIHYHILNNSTQKKETKEPTQTQYACKCMLVCNSEVFLFLFLFLFFVFLVVGCLTSKKHASVSPGRMCRHSMTGQTQLHLPRPKTSELQCCSQPFPSRVKHGVRGAPRHSILYYTRWHSGKASALLLVLFLLFHV